MIKKELGLIQVYTGNGKGKTTASLGLALRAIGHGFKVHIVQFMKGSGYSGELAMAAKLFPYLQISQFGVGCKHSALIRQGMMKCTGCGECFVKDHGVTEMERSLVNQAMDFVNELMKTQASDLLILDEIGNALRYQLVSEEQVLAMFSNKPANMELILTGRGIPKAVLEAADLVTEMKLLKHPYEKGITSRRGIEY